MMGTRDQWLGRPFVGPMFDYLVVGSAWSIAAAAVLLIRPELFARVDQVTLIWLVLVVNSAHFAASTVRLYANPANFTLHPFLTLGLPLVALVVLAVCVTFPELLGRHLQALYLTWSPYHYAAQTFGLSLMYCARSGVKIDAVDRRLLYWTCLLPFLRAFLGSPNSGLGWFVSREQLAAMPYAFETLGFVVEALTWLTFLVPAALLLRFAVVKRTGFPFIATTMIIANGIWWIWLDFLDAFIVATVAHGLQYLAIVLISHVRERRAADDSRSWWRLAGSFYLRCLVLGYALFYAWPHFFVMFGAGLAESMLAVIATINIHHFIVDRYIWRTRKPAGRAGLVESAGQSATASAS